MDPTEKLLDLSQSLWLDNITNSLEGSSTAAASADYWLRQLRGTRTSVLRRPP